MSSPGSTMDVKKMTVTELRAELEKRSLDSGGLKAVLISRLEGAIAKEKGVVVKPATVAATVTSPKIVSKKVEPAVTVDLTKPSGTAAAAVATAVPKAAEGGKAAPGLTRVASPAVKAGETGVKTAAAAAASPPAAAAAAKPSGEAVKTTTAGTGRSVTLVRTALTTTLKSSEAAKAAIAAAKVAEAPKVGAVVKRAGDATKAVGAAGQAKAPEAVTKPSLGKTGTSPVTKVATGVKPAEAGKTAAAAAAAVQKNPAGVAKTAVAKADTGATSGPQSDSAEPANPQSGDKADAQGDVMESAEAEEPKPKSGKDAVISAAAQASAIPDLEKKQRRAERFGVELQVSEDEKRKLRASRFGIENDQTKAASEEQKKALRAARFGITATATPAAAASGDSGTVKPVAVSKAPDEAEALKRKQRAERFGVAGVSNGSVDESEKKRLRAERFGTGAVIKAAGTGAVIKAA